MRLTKSKLKRIILEETEEMFSHSHPSEIDPVEAFSGGENLVLPLDHSAAVGSEPVTDSPEHYDHEEEKVVQIPQMIQVTETQLRESIREILLRIQ